MNGDAKAKAPPTPKMEASSATATRRPSTLQSSNPSSTTRTKVKPSLSSSRGTASSTTRTPKSPITPTPTSSIRRGLKGDASTTPRSPTTLTASASRRASVTPSSRSAVGPTPTPSSTLSRRSTISSINGTPSQSTLSRRSSRPSVDPTSNPSTTLQRRSTLARSSPSTTTQNTPSPSLSRRVSLNSSTTTTSRGPTPSSTTSTRSSTKPSTTSTITEEDEDDSLTALETDISELTEQIKQLEQQVVDHKEAIVNKQNEIDTMQQQVDESQSQQEERLLESILDMTEQLKEKEMKRDEALATLEQWSAQAEERAALVRQLEEMEETGQDEMETLRDELQSANDQLMATLKAMERQVEAAQETSGSLREEIQGMHKSHQTRMTGISNQLNQEHNEEITALVQSFDKELEEKQNSSEWVQVDAKRKEMIDLERTIQTLEEKLALMGEQSIKDQNDGKMDDEDKLKGIVASHEKEILESSTGYDNQISQLELEHAEEMETLKSRQQSELSLASASGVTDVNEALEKLKHDLKAELKVDYQQKLQVVHQDHQTPSNQAQTQLDDAVNNLNLLKSTVSQELDATRQRLEEQYYSEKTSAITQFETDFTQRLDAAIKDNDTSLANYRSSLEQEHTTKMDSMTTEHDQQIKALMENHNAKLLELQSSTAASTRASTERQIRADYEMKLETLAGHHRQALEDLQSDHRSAIKTLEEALEKIKESNQPASEALSTSPSPNQDHIDKSPNKNTENDNIEMIRTQVQASLNEIHSAATSKMNTEHESRLSAMKRDYILHKDRAVEQMTKDFDTRMADTKKKNADLLQSIQQAHDHKINLILTAVKGDLDGRRQILLDQHQAKTDQLKSDHQQRIQQLSNEIAQHETQRSELELVERQLQEELAAFKVSSTKEIQSLNATIDENEIKIHKDHEIFHNESLSTIRSDHQAAIDTLHSDHQMNLQHAETQEDRDIAKPSSSGIEDTLGDSYKAQIEQYVLEQETKVTSLQDTINELKQQIEALEIEHEAHLKSTEHDWKTRLEDVTKSVEQLSETTLLNEPIRTRMHGEAKDARDKLIAAHSSSLESQDITHTRNLAQLTDKQETELDELNAKLEPLLAEEKDYTEQLKKRDEEHQVQLKNLNDTHTDSVETFNAQWATKEAEYVKNLDSLKAQLEETRHQVHGLEADYKLKTARQDELQKQLDSQPASSLSNQPPTNDHDTSLPSSSTLEQEILEKQTALQAKETELQQLEEQWRTLVEEKKAAQALNNKKNEELVYGLVIRHHQEIEKMHRHFQHLLDVKDDEVNNVSYRLKTVTSARQKDIDKLQDKHHGKIYTLEDQRRRLEDSFTAKASTFEILENTHNVLKDKFTRGKTQLEQVTKEKEGNKAKLDACKAENNKLLLKIHQLQSKMHQIQLG